MKSGAQFSVQARMAYEDLDEGFELSDDAVVPLGSYTYIRPEISYNSPTGELFRPRVSFQFGPFYDGSREELELSARWNISRFIELNGEYEMNRVRFNDRGQKFNSHLGRLRVITALNTKFSTNAFIQYNIARDLVNTNFRIRYNFNKGNDLYIVYNEVLNSDRHDYEPILPVSENRTIVMKYTYTFAY